MATPSGRVDPAFLDLLGDGLARLSQDGAIEPLNRVMEELLGALGGRRRIARLADMVMEEEDREALAGFLASGEKEHRCVVRVHTGAGDRVLGMVLSRRAEGDILLGCRDETLARSCEARVRRLERMRLLSGMAEGLVHDLNNVLGGVVGFTEHMTGLSRNPDEIAFLDSIRQTTRDSAGFLQLLVRVLRRESAVPSAIPLRGPVDDVVRLFGKTAGLSSRPLQVSLADELPRVRVVHDDAVQILLHLLLALRQTTARGAEIGMSAAGERRPPASHGLPERSYGVVRLRDGGKPALAGDLQELLENPQRGLREHLDRIRGDSVGLFMSLLSLRASGGDLCFEGDDRRTVAVLFPAAGG